MVLVREHRVGGQAHLLGALDLGVPVGPLDQAAHQADMVVTCKCRHMCDQLQGAGLVGLHREAKTGPLRDLLRDLGGQCIEHFQRQLQPVHLLGVDGEVDVGCGGLLAQAPHAGYQLGHHTALLCILVTRVQRAELDRDAVVALAGAGGVCSLRDGTDRVLVTGEVFQRVGIGAGALAQHVVAVTQVGAFALGRSSLLHGLGDGLAEHELAPQQLHGAQGGGHHGARAEFGEHAARGVAVGQELLAHGNRGAGQTRQRLVAGGVEVGAAQLVGGERDGRLGVRYPQQGLGQAHQGQTLGTGDRVFLEQAFHGPERRRVPAHRLHPRRRHARCSGPIQRLRQRAQAAGDHVGLGAVGKG